MIKLNYSTDLSDVLIDVDGYFDSVFEDAWIDNELSKKLILDIDKSVVVHPHVIESPVLGPITPRELSGGVKSLILMAFDEDMRDCWFFGEQLGDNTTPGIIEVASIVKHDIKIKVQHLLRFPKTGTFEVLIENTGKVVHNDKEYMEQYFANI